MVDGLQREVTERHVGALPGHAAVLALLLLTELSALRLKHDASLGDPAGLALQDFTL